MDIHAVTRTIAAIHEHEVVTLEYDYPDEGRRLAVVKPTFFIVNSGENYTAFLNGTDYHSGRVVSYRLDRIHTWYPHEPKLRIVG